MDREKNIPALFRPQWTQGSSSQASMGHREPQSQDGGDPAETKNMV